MNEIPKKNLLDALATYKASFGSDTFVAMRVKDNKCYMETNESIMTLHMTFDLEDQDDVDEPLVIETDKLLSFLKGSTSDVLKWSFNVTHNLRIDKTRLKIAKRHYSFREWDPAHRGDYPGLARAGAAL